MKHAQRSRSVRRADRAAPGLTGSRLGVLALALLLAPTALAAQFAVYPVEIDMAAWTRVSSATITVDNQGAEPLEARIYLGDYDRTETGGHTYAEYGEHPSSCAGRLEAFPDQLSLEPGESGEVRVQLDPAAGTCWAVLFVEKRTVDPSGITFAQRIGVKILGRAEGVTPEGQVLGMAADTTAEPAAVLVFENPGEGAVRVRGEIEVRDLAGEVVEVVGMEPFRVLPQRRRRIRVSLAEAGLDPGRYLLVGVLDFGGDYLAGGQAILEVKP